MTTALYPTSGIMGANPNRVTTDAEFELGQIVWGKEGSAWVYCQASGAITGAGYVCLIDETFQADMLDTTNSASAFGQLVGVANVAFADNEYGWIQVNGVANIVNAATCSANAQLNSTGTAGIVDDDATMGSEDIEGLVILTNNATTLTASTEGLLNWPRVGATN